MRKYYLPVLSAFCFILFVQSPSAAAGEDAGIPGFGLLERICGQWHGPVFSATPAGSFENWYVDFRPVSAGQVSQYSTLDVETLNYISFFIVKYKGRLRIAMRTYGVFQNKGCITYEVMETADESRGYYKFSDFRLGSKRAYTEFTFTEDRFVMEVYTNKFNQLDILELHSRWEAELGSRRASAAAAARFNFPLPVMVKDFSTVFNNVPECIFFAVDDDPYDASSQPYVGRVTVNISVEESLPVAESDEFFLLLTTEPLFQGLRFMEDNMKFISKYVFLPSTYSVYTFNNIHPGDYYLYSYNDVNNDRKHLSGDYMSSALDNVLTVPAHGTAALDTEIDFVIP